MPVLEQLSDWSCETCLVGSNGTGVDGWPGFSATELDAKMRLQGPDLRDHGFILASTEGPAESAVRREGGKSPRGRTTWSSDQVCVSMSNLDAI